MRIDFEMVQRLNRVAIVVSFLISLALEQIHQNWRNIFLRLRREWFSAKNMTNLAVSSKRDRRFSTKFPATWNNHWRQYAIIIAGKTKTTRRSAEYYRMLNFEGIFSTFYCVVVNIDRVERYVRN